MKGGAARRAFDSEKQASSDRGLLVLVPCNFLGADLNCVAGLRGAATDRGGTADKDQDRKCAAILDMRG